MTDTHYIQKLSAFVDRELPKDEQQLVAEHLLICSNCRQEHDQIKFASTLGSILEHRDAPASVWSAIETGLDENVRQEKGWATRSGERFPTFAGYAAATVFLVAFVSLAYFFLSTEMPYQATKDTDSASLPTNSTSQPALETNAVPTDPSIAQDTNTGNVPNTPALANPNPIPGQSFGFEALAGSPQVGGRSTSSNLAVGDYLETDDISKARIEVADIGNVEVRPNSRVKLVGTGPKQHRLSLERGSLHARIVAPPRLFIVDTPTATAVDLGCEYTLEVDNAGGNKLLVTSGFVALERGGRESIVPAGAMCLTRKGKGLGTPFSAETSEAFRSALERFDFANGGSRAIDDLLANKNFYDIISLWHLLSRVPKNDRERIFDALASYVAPPEVVTREGIIALNRKMLEAWREEVERAWFE